jgi:hypothetical protein
MLKLYVDESMDAATGMWFVAGWYGQATQWKEYARRWEEALSPRTTLHLTRMRLGSSNAVSRHKDLLERLGRIPSECGLFSIAGSIRKADFPSIVSGTALEVLMEPYVMAILALLDELRGRLPQGERVKVYFEQQDAHSELRRRAVTFWKKRYRVPSGWSVITNWGVVPKGIYTEASDYLCYALTQRCIDPDSQKARLTAPILSTPFYWRHTNRMMVDAWLDHIRANRTRPIPLLTPEVKKAVRMPPHRREP